MWPLNAALYQSSAQELTTEKTADLILLDFLIPKDRTWKTLYPV